MFTLTLLATIGRNGIPTMKSLFVKAFFSIAASALLLLPSGASADKMRPGYHNFQNARGLNANSVCRRPRFNICQGCNIVIPMKVVQDRSCGFNFQSLGPFAGQDVVVSPKNGSYSLVNTTTASYRPSAGYTGRDHFESRLYFEDGSGKRTFLNLKVNVLVVPSL
jgi:hypothetical protein